MGMDVPVDGVINKKPISVWAGDWDLEIHLKGTNKTIHLDYTQEPLRIGLIELIGDTAEDHDHVHYSVPLDEFFEWVRERKKENI